MITLHERKKSGVRVVTKYVVDTLGAPFKVTLRGGVTFGVDPKTGEETVQIPDVVGLISAVVRARVSHTRKLSGAEIKFIRNAIGVRANVLSEFLDMSPEHLSRCEGGTKVMSSTSEKLFRLSAFLATFYKNPEEVFAHSPDERELKNKSTKQIEVAQKFVQIFFTMKIQPAFCADELHFEFTRRTGKVPRDEGEWSNEALAA